MRTCDSSRKGEQRRHDDVARHTLWLGAGLFRRRRHIRDVRRSRRRKSQPRSHQGRDGRHLKAVDELEAAGMLTGARRSGLYRVDRLILRYGIDAKLFEWTDEIT